MEKRDIRKILHRLDLERRQLMRPKFLKIGLTVGEGQPRILNCLLEQGEMSQRELADACLSKDFFLCLGWFLCLPSA